MPPDGPFERRGAHPRPGLRLRAPVPLRRPCGPLPEAGADPGPGRRECTSEQDLDAVCEAEAQVCNRCCPARRTSAMSPARREIRWRGSPATAPMRSCAAAKTALLRSMLRDLRALARSPHRAACPAAGRGARRRDPARRIKAASAGRHHPERPAWPPQQQPGPGLAILPAPVIRRGPNCGLPRHRTCPDPAAAALGSRICAARGIHSGIRAGLPCGSFPGDGRPRPPCTAPCARISTWSPASWRRSPAGRPTCADILAAVTPGGGKSLLPVIAAARLIEAGVVDRVCWIVPRDSLRLQAEEAFADPAWRARPRPRRLGPRRRERARPLPRACRATSPPTRASPPRPTSTSPSTAATATCWWSTRCTTCPPWPTDRPAGAG